MQRKKKVLWYQKLKDSISKAKPKGTPKQHQRFQSAK